MLPYNYSEKLRQKIISLHKQGKSIRDIAKEVFYWDKSHNKKFVSMGYVHKSIPKNTKKKDSK
ncbi:hypothetical protein ES703_118760 [subsurface metagenome]